jgi:hypothetical protein
MIKDLNKCLGIGVAGNTAGHLKEAGEIDYTDGDNCPKDIFFYYIPGKKDKHFLRIDPHHPETLYIPKSEDKIQIEPEISLLCSLQFDGHRVKKIMPKYFTAFNDCTIRSQKLAGFSEKKNWGKFSKGISNHFIKIDQFSPYGNINNYQLISYVKRDGAIHEYSKLTSPNNFLLFYEGLIAWIERKLNQGNTRFYEMVKPAFIDDYYSEALIATGCPNYTDFAIESSIQDKDEIYVVVFDQNHFDQETVKNNLDNPEFFEQDAVSYLKQKVVLQSHIIK